MGNLAKRFEREPNVRSGRVRKHPTATCHKPPQVGRLPHQFITQHTTTMLLPHLVGDAWEQYSFRTGLIEALDYKSDFPTVWRF
jgi:hypothetical protein